MLTRAGRDSIRIRDPIHGTLNLSRTEIGLIDCPVYQRLRMIKQLGLADFAFPGATHTRYAHGLGTMHIASKIFEQLARHYDLPRADHARLAQTVRLAALFHDLGHAPLSHTTEAFMPPVRVLELGKWQEGIGDRRASHEDYTLKLLIDSELTELIESRVTPEAGVTPDDGAALVAGRIADESCRDRFVVGGRDWLPVLRQCVSSELDADRMDYLLRDSYYAGVPYGRYDLEWLLENLLPVEQSDAVHLGLHARASFSFEDFLLSRYHMFTSVYFHQIPIGYEVMLRKYQADRHGELEVPADVQGYLRFDDIDLWSALRRSDSEWAQRIVERKAFRMLVEVKSFHADDDLGLEGSDVDIDLVQRELEAAGVQSIVHSAKGQLSKYFRWSERPKPASEVDLDPPLYVVDGARSVPIEQYTPLYQRYAAAVLLKRIYVNPPQLGQAREVLARCR